VDFFVASDCWERFGGSLTFPVALARLHGNRAGAFLAFANFVDHGLTFGKLLDLHAAQLGVVEKQVVAAGGDEPESLFGDDFLDLTFWHFCSPENTKPLAGATNRSRGSAPAET
jgi:hypothetical protein